MNDGQPADAGNMRDDLNAAFDAAETGTPAPVVAESAPPPVVETAPVVPAETPAEKAERIRDEGGRFAKATKPPPETPAESKTATPPTVKTEPAAVEPPPADAAPAEKAPISWTAKEREAWGKVPHEAREPILRRERETNIAFMKLKPLEQVRDALQATVSPYLGMMQAEGLEPLKLIGETLQTWAALRTAPAIQKTRLVAGMIRDYGISVDMLADVLDGPGAGSAPGAPGAAGHAALPPEWAAELEEMRKFRQGLEHKIATSTEQRSSELMTRAQGQVEEFAASHEFYEDLRPTMAALSKAGVATTLEDLYDAALALPKHAEVRGIVQQREAAKQAATVTAATQRAKDAASSVRSRPAPMPVNGKVPDDLRGALEAAMAAHGR